MLGQLPGEKDPLNLMRIMPPQGSVAPFSPHPRRSSLYSPRGASMNANPKLLSATAHVDEAAVKSLPNSRKIYVEGSRPDVRVPMREISQSDTPAEMGAEKNPPI